MRDRIFRHVNRDGDTIGDSRLARCFTLCFFAESKAELSIHFTVSFRLQCSAACSKAFTTER